MTTLITPYTTTPSRLNPSTFSSDRDIRLAEENSRIVQMNAQANENNAAMITTTAKANEASASAIASAASAAAASQAANRAEAVVIPTAATYSYTQQDWRQSMMSKTEFNDMATERMTNRAGSGFDEWGQHYGISALYDNINEGMWVENNIPNRFELGMESFAGGGVSKTLYPIVNVNGVRHRIESVNIAFSYYSYFTQPTAPTVLPYTATLTQQQIDSGVIKHADASNSGLITGGTGLSGTTFSQVITTVIGKKYTIEWIDNAVYNTLEVTATALTYTVSLSGTDITRVAVFPVDAISRSDLTFFETWHEDVSEKDFVYPLGNVQYMRATGDCGNTVAGSFAGYGTYSLFSDAWQADNALIGKGYVWSTLSDTNKKAFVANHENNCYLDGDKIIQVRYRCRVVMGCGDTWASVKPYESFLAYGTNSNGAGSLMVSSKGKAVTRSFEYTDNTLSNHWVRHTITDLVTGIFVNPVYQSDETYTGTQLLILPIALVHRRNQGGYDATYNPNGSKAMTMTPTTIADCFTEANLTVATGYIGTSTPRPDGLFYDQVSIEDFKPANKGADLRNNSKKRTAHQVIEEFAPKVIAGTIPYYTNDTTPLTTYKDAMEVRDTSGNRYAIKSLIGNVATISDTVANKKGFTVVTQNGKQYLQVADDPASDTTVQMNLSTIKYDVGVFDA